MNRKQWIKENNLKHGDKIKILCSPNSKDLYWNKFIGKVYYLDFSRNNIEEGADKCKYIAVSYTSVKKPKEMGCWDIYPITCLKIVNKEEEYVYKRKSLLNWKEENLESKT